MAPREGTGMTVGELKAGPLEGNFLISSNKNFLRESGKRPKLWLLVGIMHWTIELQVMYCINALSLWGFLSFISPEGRVVQRAHIWLQEMRVPHKGIQSLGHFNR